MNINLSDFVSSTIVEIASGIEQAKELLKERDVRINPVLDEKGRALAVGKGIERAVQEIEFDLLVSVDNVQKQKDEDNVSAKIQVVSIINLSLGGGTKNSEELEYKNSAVNRIKFTIPVSFGTNTEAKAVENVRITSF